MGTMESAQTLAPPLCAYIAKPIAATARPIIHQYSAWMVHGHWQCKSASQLGFQPCLHLGAICLCLRALRTCGGRATPSVNKPREWGCCGGPLPSLWGCVGYGVLVVDLGSVAHTPGREYHSPVPHTGYLGLFLCIQPQSSPQVCPLKPEFQHPATPPSRPLTPALCPHILADTCPRLSNASR